MKTLLKNWFTLLVVIAIVGINIYNHYDRLESEERIRKQVKEFSKDVDLFIYHATEFDGKCEEFLDKLENGEKIYVNK